MNYEIKDGESMTCLARIWYRPTSVSAQYTPREVLLCLMIRITNPIVIVVDAIAIVSMYFGLPDRKNPGRKEKNISCQLGFMPPRCTH
jgi:hypothetical protein